MKLSRRRRQILAKDSGHDVQLDGPATVVRAISSVSSDFRSRHCTPVHGIIVATMLREHGCGTKTFPDRADRLARSIQ